MVSFADAARWTKEKLDLEQSIAVTVRDGADAADNILVVPGNSEFASMSVGEYAGTEKTFDWLVSAEDLKFVGQKREPKTGGEIWQPLDGARRAIYTAVAPGDGRCFDVMDDLGIMLRIHTVLLRIENV